MTSQLSSSHAILILSLDTFRRVGFALPRSSDFFMEGCFGIGVDVCCHKKPFDDPHPLCRKCRPCSFFTNECSVCEAMSTKSKKDIERTWLRSDARQSQRVRRKKSDSEPALDPDSAPTAAADFVREDTEQVVSPVFPVPKSTHRVDYVKSTAADAASRDDTCADSNMAAVTAENVDLRRQLALLQTQMPLVPPQLPENIFNTPPRNHHFPGFDAEFVASASFQPPTARQSAQVADVAFPVHDTHGDTMLRKTPLLPTPTIKPV